MGLRGPAGTPTALKIIRGNPGKRPINKREPKPEVEAPPCPEYIKADPEALATWNYYLPILMRMRVLTEADGLVLANLCLAHSFLLANLAKVREMNAAPAGRGIAGMVIPTKNGYFAINQLYANARDAMEQELKFCKELGLSPSSRTRLQTAPEKPSDSKWAKFAKD